MTPRCERVAACRLCGGKRLEGVMSLAPTPPAAAFVGTEHLAQKQPSYPLDLVFCLDCTHLQLLHTLDAEALFRDYVYVSASSPGLTEHFHRMAERLILRARPEKGALAVDIGSNDGTLLSVLKKNGLRVLGVDPAREIARRATQAGIETLPEFFTLELARRIRSERGPATLVTAHNVFAHSDDMAGMAEGARELLAPGGLFAFEASYVVDVVDKMLLGAIFHEHLCYHAVGPLRAFLARHGLELINVEQVPTQGGAIVGFAQKAGGPFKTLPSVEHLIAQERERGFDRPRVYRDFAKRVDALRGEIQFLMRSLKTKGRRIAGFGAARGGTTMICHFGLDEFLEYLVDDNSEKHHLFSPGFHIPVLPSQVLSDRKPDHLFLLAWVHAGIVMEKHRAYRDAGGRFILSFPKLEVI